MSKTIELPSGERLLVSDDVDEIKYDEEAFPLHLAKKILEQQTKEVLEGLSLLLVFSEEDYPMVPVHLKTYKVLESGVVKVCGTMLSSDFMWIIEKEVRRVKELAVDLSHRRFLLNQGRELRIKTISAKDINATAMTVNILFEINT